MTLPTCFADAREAVLLDHLVVCIPGTQDGDPVVVTIAWDTGKFDDEGCVMVHCGSDYERAVFAIVFAAEGHRQAHAAGVCC